MLLPRSALMALLLSLTMSGNAGLMTRLKRLSLTLNKPKLPATPLQQGKKETERRFAGFQM